MFKYTSQKRISWHYLQNDFSKIVNNKSICFFQIILDFYTYFPKFSFIILFRYFGAEFTYYNFSAAGSKTSKLKSSDLNNFGFSRFENSNFLKHLMAGTSVSDTSKLSWNIQVSKFI